MVASMDPRMAAWMTSNAFGMFDVRRTINRMISTMDPHLEGKVSSGAAST